MSERYVRVRRTPINRGQRCPNITLTSDVQVLSSLTMEQAALLEEESEYSYADSEYMSDEEMLMQEFPDNPPRSVQMLLEAALNKLEDIKLDLEDAETELEGEVDDELDDDDLDVEMDEDDFDDELDEDISKCFFLTNLI